MQAREAAKPVQGLRRREHLSARAGTQPGLLAASIVFGVLLWVAFDTTAPN